MLSVAEKFEAIVAIFENTVSRAPFSASLKEKEREFNDVKAQGAHSLYISRLVEIYKEYVTALFEFSPQEHLRHLLELFSHIYPQETEQLRAYLFAYKFNESSEPGDNVLLKGAIQSGKTLAIILSCMCYLACDRDVFVVVRNKIDDKLQFIERFQDAVRALKELASFSHENFMVIDKKDMAPAHPCLFIELYHSGNQNIKP